MKEINSMNLSWTRILVFTVITYIFSHALMLLVYGAWWDDMLLWNVSSSLLEKFLGPSSFNNPFLYAIVSSINEISSLTLKSFVYRIIPFVCWLVSCISFFFVTKKVTNHKQFTLYASLLMASCGLNKSMIMICCYGYSISIMLFMIGLVYFVNDFYKNSRMQIVWSSFFWLLSLLVWRSAVLVIPVIVIIACIINISFDWKSLQSYKELFLVVLKKYGIIILALVVFSGLYLTILAPKGVYHDYYHISVGHIILSPILTFTSCLSVFYQYVSGVYSTFAYVGGLYYFSLILLPLFLLFFLKNNLDCKELSKSLLLISIVLFFFSIMPQKLIGNSYSFLCDMQNQNSRQASLAVFPVCFIISYLFLSLNRIIRPFIVGVFFTGSILLSNYICLDYERGWARNVAISHFLEKHKELDGKKILIYNNAQEYSIFKGTGDSYYEYEGCARLAYGINTQTQFRSFYVDSVFGSDFVPDYHVVFGRKEPSPRLGLKLMFTRLFKPQEYDEIVDQMLFFNLSDEQPFK